MKIYRFYKEYINWFLDLPDWNGNKEDLEMVLGADSLLEVLSEGNNEIHLSISEECFDGASKLDFNRFGEDYESGAFYNLRSYRNIEFDFEIWLCDVTLSIFDRFPESIYFNVIK